MQLKQKLPFSGKNGRSCRKGDAVEESLESKAKNDEDSSEKETIEKPESPESN